MKGMQWKHPIMEYVRLEIMRRSELTFFDYVGINASWHYMQHQRQFNCDQNRKRYSDIQLEDFLNKNGCGHRYQDKPRHVVEGIAFHSCLCDYRHPLMNMYLNLHDKYKAGHLPDSGTILEQPAQLMSIFEILDDLYYKRESKLAAEQHEINRRVNNGRN